MFVGTTDGFEATSASPVRVPDAFARIADVFLPHSASSCASPMLRDEAPSSCGGPPMCFEVWPMDPDEAPMRRDGARCRCMHLRSVGDKPFATPLKADVSAVSAMRTRGFDVASTKV